jgi:very-short-patch-repair endonuclease
MPKLDRFRIKSARRLRSTMTDAERILWSQLWRIPVEGTHFRKQSPIGRYYADFVSHRLKLVVELDGAQHALEERLEKDAERDRWLAAEGYRVLRFWNNEVREELDSVLDTIYAAVEERRLAVDCPAPHPGAARRPSPSRGG